GGATRADLAGALRSDHWALIGGPGLVGLAVLVGCVGGGTDPVLLRALVRAPGPLDLHRASDVARRSAAPVAGHRRRRSHGPGVSAAAHAHRQGRGLVA